MAGKGDRMRKVDGEKYRDNYDQITWSKPESTTYYWPLDMPHVKTDTDLISVNSDLDMLHVDFQHPTNYSGIDDEPIQNQ